MAQAVNIPEHLKKKPMEKLKEYTDKLWNNQTIKGEK